MADSRIPADESFDVNLLHEIGSRMAAADPLHEVLAQVVEFVAAVVTCDSASFMSWRKVNWCFARQRILTLKSSIICGCTWARESPVGWRSINNR